MACIAVITGHGRDFFRIFREKVIDMTKKICPEANGRTQGDVLGYSYPRYHDTKKSSYVDFRAYDPARGEMRRKKYYVGNIKSKKERNRHANELIVKLARDLAAGWNPWANVTNFRGYTELNDVLDRYMESISRSSRLKTIQTYSSKVNIFKEFLSQCPVAIKYAYQYDRQLVTEFLDYIVIDRDASPRTRNNYKGWCGALGQFMADRKYISENPAASMANVRTPEKKRQALPAAMLRKLTLHLQKTNRHFLLAVMMEYYTFIRPTELTNLRLRDFNLREQSVTVDASFSKNKRTQTVGINATIIKLMLDLRVFEHPGDWYLFSRDFLPGVKKLRADAFNKYWATVRKALRWGNEYQFYSLKDSGIRDLANAEGIVTARDQARHTDISTTNRYLGRENGVREETKHFSGEITLDRDDRIPL